MTPLEPLPTDRAALIARIKKVAVTPVRFRKGYDECEVDDFLDEIVASLAKPLTGPQLSAAQIRDREVRQVGFRGGYDIEQVDDFRRLIAEAVQSLR
jgi:DivIVA domain-containing protein